MNFKMAMAVAIVGLCIPAMASAQSNSNNSGATMEYADAVEFGEGTLQTYASVTPAGKPLVLGVRLTGGAVDGAPAAHSHDGEGHQHFYEVILPIPSNAADATSFTFLMLNWNPGGHEPPGIYDIPHFDFHFYMTPPSVHQSILPGTCDGEGIVDCETAARGAAPLPDDQRIENYVNIGTVPFMGAHLVDVTSPEFHGETFDRTLIYGAYDANLMFVEPMITRDFMQQKRKRDCTVIPTPQAFPEAGYHPTQYCTQYWPGDDSYTVSLESFEWFPASNGVVSE